MGCFSKFKPEDVDAVEEEYPLRDSGFQGPEGNLPKSSTNVKFGSGQIIACHSGPDQGVAEVQTAEWQLDWANNSLPVTCGRCESLYEVHPETGVHAGDPVADCFGAVTFPDSCALALADGVSWGAKPRTAARRAVYAALRGLSAIVKSLAGQATNSSSVFAKMLQVIKDAQEFIVQDQQVTLTTLCMALVVPMAAVKGPPTWVVLAITIGDSPCYVYRALDGNVEQISYGLSTSSAIRDMRICPGALGFASDREPDLGNMTLHITHARPGDVVFLASDGICDNFDPIVRKVAVPHRAFGTTRALPKEGSKPTYSYAMCQQKAVEEMQAEINRARGDKTASAKVVVDCLMEYVLQQTEPYRRLCQGRSGQETEEEWEDMVAETPGKPDHAAVVAFCVPGGR